MSLSWGTQYPKLKTNLRLAINRLKLLEKKKTEMALKSRSEISDFIANHKEDRARIRVEHIIREDFLVEAYELLEMYCDLLLARFGLIEQLKQLDDGIAEAVISILWAAPRVAADVISDQLTLKYGKVFAEAARANQLEYPAKVSPKLIAKLSVQAPPKLLVERYMIEIAKSSGTPFTPDANIMREDEIAAAEQMLIDFKNQGGQGYGWMYPGNESSIGSGQSGPQESKFNQTKGNPNTRFPPEYYAGSGNFDGSNCDSDRRYSASSGEHFASQPPPLNYPRLSQIGSNDDITKVRPNDNPGIPSAPPAAPLPSKNVPGDMNISDFPEPPSDFPDDLDSVIYPSPRNNRNFPGSGGNSQSPSDGNELDFEDLAKRFDMLKKKGNK
ncbi:unnamed protein product [Dracunculus medinensis]|uniref:IST1 homolog n=1 Tax=Dracunculus medinensis TaxID=318479 RepID=A0A0N4U1A0_DRAME|nr:unnamed protein product [Dracunculus medinensis]